MFVTDNLGLLIFVLCLVESYAATVNRNWCDEETCTEEKLFDSNNRHEFIVTAPKRIFHQDPTDAADNDPGYTIDATVDMWCVESMDPFMIKEYSFNAKSNTGFLQIFTDDGNGNLVLSRKFEHADENVLITGDHPSKVVKWCIADHQQIFGMVIKGCVDVSSCVCQDAGGLNFQDGSTITCPNYVTANPCKCDEGNLAELCCLSCSNADKSECDCRDKLSPSSPLTFTDALGNPIPITDCGVMAEQYLVLCKTYGGAKGHCCKSCHGKDTTCVDELNGFYRGFEESGTRELFGSCAALTNRRKCECAKDSVAGQCCISCYGFDAAVYGCDCQDRLGWDMIKLTYDDSEIRSCQVLIEDYPGLCETGVGQQACCASCIVG